MKHYDITIVGAGPSGLFAAYELSKELGRKVSIKIFDKGKGVDERGECLYDLKGKCNECLPCNVTEGIMGTGLKSDGKVHFYKEAIQLWRDRVIDDKYCNVLLGYIESRFKRWGMKNKVYPTSFEDANSLVKKVESLNLADQFELQVKERIRHIGSDELPKIVKSMLKEMEGYGNVTIFTRHNFIDYRATNKKMFAVYFSNGNYSTADHFIIGLGRKNSPFIQEMIWNLGIPFTHKPVEIGGRIETPQEVTAEYTNTLYNLAFRQKSDRTGDVSFTFCTNPFGYVVPESILPRIIGVNGESKNSNRSIMTNFAVLTELRIPQGDDPNAALREILIKGFLNEEQVVYVQSLPEFMNQPPSKVSKYSHERTLRKAFEAYISSLFPQRVTDNLKGFISNLGKVFPDLIGPWTSFYAPEAKVRGTKVSPISDNLETTVENLSLIGDSSGLSGNIVDAALTGVLAARGIISKMS